MDHITQQLVLPLQEQMMISICYRLEICELNGLKISALSSRATLKLEVSSCVCKSFRSVRNDTMS